MKSVTTTIRYRYEVLLPNAEEHDRWKAEANKRQMAMSELIRTAVNQYLSGEVNRDNAC